MGGANVEGGYGIDNRWYASTAGGPYDGAGQKVKALLTIFLIRMEPG